ncbi:type II secretion protein [Vibrio kanaloae]|uniref:AAA family ATPase n=1 Tax=Vibrio kanaloae TaxID=170673 RepID=UPI0010BEDDD6|nr:AAA family ATPase [Vibrio kanaloae]TKE90156.1 type II secretion protein [Vibrio kanaloae]TKF15312.1 type II secretion protein [Vibrio kanaloae]
MGEAIKITPNENDITRLKTNLKVWVIHNSESFKSHVNHELKKCRNVSITSFSLAGMNEEYLKGVDVPELIFVEASGSWAQKMVELQGYDLSLEDKELSLVVLGDESDSGSIKIALRLGASDFLPNTVTLSDLLPLLKKTASEKLENSSYGEFILFLNTKGGMGATTLALNTAIEVASHHAGEVLLLDIDLQFGVIPDYLNITPTYSISDAINSSNDLDEISLGSLVNKHESGLHVLSFKHENNADDYEQAQKIGRLLPILRRFYPYVIIDLSRGLDHVFASAISPATKVLLVSQQSLVSVKNTSRLIKSLKFEYGLQSDVIEVILNRYEKRHSIKLKDIEQAVGDHDIHLIPNDFKVTLESTNLGQPFVQSRKKSSITRSIIDLSHVLSPLEHEEKGWLKKLFS